MARRLIIKCPHCGCEYLAGEIYIPKLFVGEPCDIIRDEVGAILGHQGSDMNTKETYICDKCDGSFNIDATITFKTTPNVDIFAVDDDFKDIVNKK